MKTITTGSWEGSAGGLKAKHSLFASNMNYTPYSVRNVSDIVIHYTGNERDTAKGNANYFHTGSRGASAHFFVDETSIWQSVRLVDMAWHFSADQYKHPTARNHNTLGIELCTSGNYKVSEKTKENGAQLCAQLCKLIDISADQVNEHVFRHWDMTGKNCPAQMAGAGNKEWAQFKARVKQILEGDEEMTKEQFYQLFQESMAKYSQERAAKPAAKWAENGIAQVKEAGVMSGDSNGQFRPQSFITRQEAAVSQAAILRKVEQVDKRVSKLEGA